MRDTLKANFEDGEFDEYTFSILGENLLKPKAKQIISWTTLELSYYNPRTRQNEEEIRKIIHIENIVTSSHTLLLIIRRLSYHLSLMLIL